MTGKALDAGKMYPVGLKFGSSVALSGVATTDGNGATVTLCDVVIYAPSKCDHAAIHCLGDANIVLAGSEYNYLDAGSSAYPALFVPQGNTLTISGTAELYAQAQDSYSAGIGSGYDYDTGTLINCGTIVIAGGVIKAMGGFGAAGIGSGYRGTCGTVTIDPSLTVKNFGEYVYISPTAP